MNAGAPNLLLFVVLPYVALAIFFGATILRFRMAPQTFSSRSSQFFEAGRHFAALNAFHYGMIVVFLGHVAGLIIPAGMHAWSASPLRIYVLEIAGLTAALMALAGIILVIVRRIRVPLVRATTTRSDVLVLALLAFQLCTGIQVAVSRPWAAAWFEMLLGPYVRSLAAFSPDTSYVAAVPLAIKIHIVCAWVIIAVFPFTRLVHMLVVPVAYLWRKFELVRWSGPRASVSPHTPTAAALHKTAAGRD